MNKPKLIIRHDDFDFRMGTEKYIDIHEKFIEKGLIETAVIQLTQYGRVQDFERKKELIDYINSTPNWDIQFHCWEHKPYLEMDPNEIIKEVAASLYFINKLFGKTPTVWYPPHNVASPRMEMIAKEFGLKVNTGHLGIEEFVKGGGKINETIENIHFHGWANHEMLFFDRMLDMILEYENR